MKNTGMILALTSALLGWVSTSHAQANIRVGRGTVVPIVIETGLNLRENRVGDRFIAKVDAGDTLPWGTEFIGRVVAAHSSRGDRPGSMELEFSALKLPDGSQQSIHSVIVSLERNGRARDGRVMTERGDNRSGENVIGGAVGGAAVGSIFRKPVEGAIIGILGGILASETSRSSNSNVVLRRGQRFGALIEQEIRFTYGGEFRKYRAPREDQPRDDRRADDRRTEDRRGDDRRGDDRRAEDRRTEDRRGEDQKANDRNVDWRTRDRMEERTGRSSVQSSGPSSAPNQRDRANELTYKGRVLTFSQDLAPIVQGNTVLVPLLVTASQLGLEVDDARGQVIYIDNGESTMRLNRETGEVRMNGRKLPLNNVIQERRGVIFVPAEIFRELRGADFQYSRNVPRG